MNHFGSIRQRIFNIDSRRTRHLTVSQISKMLNTPQLTLVENLLIKSGKPFKDDYRLHRRKRLEIFLEGVKSVSISSLEQLANDFDYSVYSIRRILKAKGINLYRETFERKFVEMFPDENTNMTVKGITDLIGCSVTYTYYILKKHGRKYLRIRRKNWGQL